VQEYEERWHESSHQLTSTTTISTMLTATNNCLQAQNAAEYSLLSRTKSEDNVIVLFISYY